jgi:hypothetical protein
MKSIVALTAVAVANATLSDQVINIVNDKLSHVEGQHSLAAYSHAWTHYFDDLNTYYAKFTFKSDL